MSFQIFLLPQSTAQLPACCSDVTLHCPIHPSITGHRRVHWIELCSACFVPLPHCCPWQSSQSRQNFCPSPGLSQDVLKMLVLPFCLYFHLPLIHSGLQFMSLSMVCLKDLLFYPCWMFLCPLLKALEEVPLIPGISLLTLVLRSRSGVTIWKVSYSVKMTFSLFLTSSNGLQSRSM